ncbi:unsaturated rhamnogalacturonyl hydrolase [Flavobacterium fluvii]|uniref:Unsaturated rhamnogalacturonyl hydrolase n=1 Tax=Flavobacterium fluvii TaxID=468056 RepID=A0A1M5DWR3_9FLAO|nr:glycoside hydrolase family 88 protein [Flavobacterium fluvii]SHF71366.1 unsaturated rhamnogalacturonyl hydrolase [Flavobacterium fluvii]
MRKFFLIVFLIVLPLLGKAQITNFGIQFSDAIISRYQPTINAFNNNGWDHANSIILHGMEKIYGKTKNPGYVKYIKDFVDSYVDEKGNVKGLKTELDGIHPGLLCLFLYETTKEEKYKIAATNMRNYLLGTTAVPTKFSKTPDGGYWHKNNDHYEDVMTIDGVYMANPFLLKYGIKFGDTESVDSALFQTFLAASRMFNIETHLPYHGWDYKKKKSWASPITGTATEVWSRNAGWFSMALADMLEFLPPTHKDYKKLLYLYQQLAIGIKNTQNKEALWCQLINHKELADNYTETSGSGMIIYALKKGLNNKWLDESYAMVIENGWEGFKKYIAIFSDGKPQIKSFCPGMGIKDNIKEYLSVRPVDCPSNVSKNQPHGYCAVLMAASVME